MAPPCTPRCPLRPSLHPQIRLHPRASPNLCVSPDAPAAVEGAPRDPDAAGEGGEEAPGAPGAAGGGYGGGESGPSHAPVSHPGVGSAGPDKGAFTGMGPPETPADPPKSLGLLPGV